MYIAIDIGGTNIRVAAFKNNNQFKFKFLKKFFVVNNYKQDLEKIISTITDFKVKVDSIGVSVAGKLDSSGKILVSPNLTGWNGKKPALDLNKHFKCRVVIQNDAYAGALAEAEFGKGRKKEFLYIIWGTGIGGAIVRVNNHKPIITALEPGHQVFNFTKRKCGCGQIGCLELSCGGDGIVKTYKKNILKITDKQWNEVGNRIALGIAQMLVNNPVDIIIFAGAIAVHRKNQIKQIKQNLKNNLHIIKPPTKLMVSSFKDYSSLAGALALLKYYDKN